MSFVVYDSMSAFRMRLENGEKQLLRGILNEAKQHAIFVWDSRGGNDARRAVFPGYKNRPPAPSQMREALSMIRELLSHTTAWQAWLEGFEADDIIAAICQRLPVARIETMDGDLAALGVPTTRKSKIPTELIRLYKTCVGDPSDTIPGIKGFGKGAWEAADKARLQAFIDRIINDGPYTEMDALEAGLSKASAAWVLENEDQVRAMWTVVHPLPMSDEQLDQALRQGTDNPMARESIMKEFLL